MADNYNKTTSSKTLEGNKDENMSTASLLPKSEKQKRMLAKLAYSVTESYNKVKRQSQPNKEPIVCVDTSGEGCASGDDLQQLRTNIEDENEDINDGNANNWQPVKQAKNRLKRKKKLSTSLSSVTDTVNQEKRTCIEGIQLNCRGKLQLNESGAIPLAAAHSCGGGTKTVTVRQRTPLPPPTTPASGKTLKALPTSAPRVKRKLEQNVQTIQKLNALTEQLRLEVKELRTHLNSERGAVRTLRSQSEAETRKWKNEVKKLQSTLDIMKKHVLVHPSTSRKHSEAADNSTISSSVSLANYEIQRLTHEIAMLKEANRALEEKKGITCDADRRKAADMRALSDSYEIRLTQLTKSAKNEITRLLEEIKSKERSIGQLKRELQVLKIKSTKSEIKSRNATTNKTTNKTTSKPKKTVSIKKKTNDAKNPAEKEGNQVTTNDALNPNEMKKLKDIELINNTKNLHSNVGQKTTRILCNSQKNNDTDAFEGNELRRCNHFNDANFKNLVVKISCGQQTDNEYHSMPLQIAECLLGKMKTVKTATSTTTTQTEEDNNVHEYRNKYNNSSDTDSALSSAPQSISPQPPPAGMDTTDIWQTIRTYNADIEKLQKEMEMLQKENERQRSELSFAHEQIRETEKTAVEPPNTDVLEKLSARIKYLEDREHKLVVKTTELKEQNELLEFRLLEIEDVNWSVRTPPSAKLEVPLNSVSAVSAEDVWLCEQQFSLGRSTPNLPCSMQCEDDFSLVDVSNEELIRRISSMLSAREGLDEEDKQCLRHLLTVVQQLEMLSMRSGPNSLNTNSSGEEGNSLEMVKSRISDYSSASSSPSASSTCDQQSKFSQNLPNSTPQSTTSPRIVATVQPYNTNAPQQSHSLCSTATSSGSPRRALSHTGQSVYNSLTESGVFVEADFPSDICEQNVCTQTDFDDTYAKYTTNGKGVLDQGPVSKPLTTPLTPPCLSPEKRLQYYKDRLEVLERKVLIYESSGDLQTKRLTERLQREVELEKQLKELHERVESLEQINSALEEEKCEFEEAENDTRLRLQRLEIELDILSQRNVELVMSKEALSAKYNTCHTEWLNCLDDIAVNETQIHNLEKDKQLAKDNLEFLHSVLPLVLIYNSFIVQQQFQQAPQQENYTRITPTPTQIPAEMGNLMPVPGNDAQPDNCIPNSLPYYSPNTLSCSEECSVPMMPPRELQYLKEEVRCLRHQIKELNTRHYEALESADSHWVDLEREYKEREEAYRAKEQCLKQKIQKLQDCLRDDARAAREKIEQMEESDKEMKCCLLRVSKEHRDLSEKHQQLINEFERLKEQHDGMKEQQRPLLEALEQEKKHTKTLTDEVSFMRKLQQESESRNLAELEVMRKQLFEMKKEFLHIEVTNSELKEEVSTLEQEIGSLNAKDKETVDKIRVLSDEVRSKEEVVAKLERRLERAEGFSLADELAGGRFRREDVKDLKTATKGLAYALKNMKECEAQLPAQAQQFRGVAREVKKLADTLLYGKEDDINIGDEQTLAPVEHYSEEQSGEGYEEIDSEGIKQEQTELEEITELESEIKEEFKILPEDTEVATDHDDGGEDDTDRTDPDEDPHNDGAMTVGMAFLPEFILDERFMKFVKNPIAEVPSVLRKLAHRPVETTEPMTEVSEMNDPSDTTKLKKVNELKRRKTGKRRKVKRRLDLFSPNRPTLQTRVRRIVSSFNARRPQCFYDVSDIDVCQSEVLQRSISYDSFHSLHDDAAVVVDAKVDASTETDCQKIDRGTETDEEFVCKIESGVQVSEVMSSERLLEVIPSQTRSFLYMLRSSVSQTDVEAQTFNVNIYKHWQAHEEFRVSLDILQSFTSPMIEDDLDIITEANYERFVNALSCLSVLEDMFKPLCVPMLKQIEEQIKEELINYHNRRMESEFYCTVYYPVKRQRPVPADLTDYAMK